MSRHRVAAVAAAALIAVALAGCGGDAAASPTRTPTEPPTEAPAPTDAPVASDAPTDEPESPTSAPHTTARALCGGVALRKEPATDGEVVVRARAGQRVRVVEIVPGDAYRAGSCGSSGNSWLRVDRLAGKSIQAQYGVPFAYVAAGFFE